MAVSRAGLAGGLRLLNEVFVSQGGPPRLERGPAIWRALSGGDPEYHCRITALAVLRPMRIRTMATGQVVRSPGNTRRRAAYRTEGACSLELRNSGRALSRRARDCVDGARFRVVRPGKKRQCRHPAGDEHRGRAVSEHHHGEMIGKDILKLEHRGILPLPKFPMPFSRVEPAKGLLFLFEGFL